MNKALFFDIDGTLVSFKTHEVPESTIEALQKAHDRGNKIFISTGRPYQIINNLGPLQQRGLIDGYITMNGAYCFIDDNVLYKSPIPQETVKNVAEISRREGFPTIFVGEKSMKVCQPDEEVRKIFYEFLHVEVLPVATFDEVVDIETYQMTPFFTTDFEPKIKPYLNQCELNRWYPTFVDITAKGNTKAHGIKVILDYLHLSVDDAMAFGDGGNDIPMLLAAGTGIAMGNSDDKVKAAADYVTTSVDDNGIANALQRFGLI
ncbi:Cof-type HAD-IIB family hydrolase [uncultured Muribaculum sp.]|uniref:Cof-type HAD-IIB family hydrolase n=2 Tax=uncultured Muribaculum sp. TaxID=1918613 RepID=UPI0025B1521F|nr:Cof-type HAD-IIB family hydrolase [uncultured Muribaculum sp.]